MKAVSTNKIYRFCWFFLHLIVASVKKQINWSALHQYVQCHKPCLAVFLKVKLSLCSPESHMVDRKYSDSLLASTMDGGLVSFMLSQEKSNAIHWIKNGVGPSVCLDALEKTDLPCPWWECNTKSLDVHPITYYLQSLSYSGFMAVFLWEKISLQQL